MVVVGVGVVVVKCVFFIAVMSCCALLSFVIACCCWKNIDCYSWSVLFVVAVGGG